MKHGSSTILSHLTRITHRTCGCGRTMLYGWLRARAGAAHPWLFTDGRGADRTGPPER